MKDTKVLIFGAGRSSVYFIKQLYQYFLSTGGTVTIIDQDFKHLEPCDFSKSVISLKKLHISDIIFQKHIPSHDIIVSLLPAHYHIKIATYCLQFDKNLLTASYVDDAMQQLDAKAKRKGLVFLNEMGLDPGLDHMSAMSLLNAIKTSGGTITSYASHTGGLTQPSSEIQDWNYKFTWNPKNVITAGQQGAVFLKNKAQITLEYTDVFKSYTPLKVGSESYDSYPNRNSLKYQKLYHLETTPSVYRGTLRHKGFCAAWQIFIDLRMTDDTTVLQFPKDTTHNDFLRYFLPKDVNKTISQIFCDYFKIDTEHPIYKKIEGLDFFNSKAILTNLKGTAAELLLLILSIYWKLPQTSLDVVVMKHEIEFEKNNQQYIANSLLKIEGENAIDTAMAKTVGAPLLEGLKLLLEEKILERGVIIPTISNLYTPVLKNLKNHGIIFEEDIKIKV